MSTTARGFFTFLVLLLPFSAVLGYAGIARLHRMHFPPFNQGSYEFSGGSISYLPDRAIVFLDSTGGRAVVWALAVIIPAGCVVLAFKCNRQILGFGVLFCFGALYGTMALKLFFHSMLGG
jgi:hypothetical protein